MAYRHINLAGTYNITSGGGTLKRIVVNTTAAGAITVYDDDSAVATSLVATLKSNIVENSYEYDIQYNRGLTIVTAAASDITVVYT